MLYPRGNGLRTHYRRLRLPYDATVLPQTLVQPLHPVIPHATFQPRAVIFIQPFPSLGLYPLLQCFNLVVSSFPALVPSFFLFFSPIAPFFTLHRSDTFLPSACPSNFPESFPAWPCHINHCLSSYLQQ